MKPNKEGLTYYAAFYPPPHRLKPFCDILAALPPEDRQALFPKNLVPPVYSGERRKGLDDGRGGWAVFPSIFDPTLNVEVIADGRVIFIQEGKTYVELPELSRFVPTPTQIEALSATTKYKYPLYACSRALEEAKGNEAIAKTLLATWKKDALRGRDEVDNNPYDDFGTYIPEGPVDPVDAAISALEISEAEKYRKMYSKREKKYWGGTRKLK